LQVGAAAPTREAAGAPLFPSSTTCATTRGERQQQSRTRREDSQVVDEAASGRRVRAGPARVRRTVARAGPRP